MCSLSFNGGDFDHHVPPSHRQEFSFGRRTLNRFDSPGSPCRRVRRHRTQMKSPELRTREAESGEDVDLTQYEVGALK